MARRQFNTMSNIKKNISKEFGQGLNEDFLPEQEDIEIEHRIKQETTISLTARPDELLRHQEDFNGILYKYDLPIINTSIVFKSNALVVQDEEADVNTTTENLFNELDCDKDTAFESFIVKHH